jgi:hypothetical protein
MYGYLIREKSCKNACVESLNSSLREIDKCNCDEQCVEFGDCCLDYWKR